MNYEIINEFKGGFAKVIEINEASGRLTQAVLQMDPTLFQVCRHLFICF